MKYLTTLALALLTVPAYSSPLPSQTSAHYDADVSTGYLSCEAVINRYGHRSLIHGVGSMLDRPMAIRTCRVAVEAAHKIGLRGEVVRYTIPAWGIQESNWAAAAQGGNTELGPLQIKRQTCVAVIGRPCRAKDGLVIHTIASLRYLDYMRDFGNGSWQEALSAYRVGPGGWRRASRCIRDGGCTEIDTARRITGLSYSGQVQGRAVALSP
jgi:hypothetical protein